MINKFRIKTKEEGFYNITSFVRQTVLESGIREGIAVIFTPECDGGIVISDLDQNVLCDEELALINMDFSRSEYGFVKEPQVKSMLTGVSQTVIVTESEPVLGKNQGVCFAEFNPGDERIFYIKVLRG